MCCRCDACFFSVQMTCVGRINTVARHNLPTLHAKGGVSSLRGKAGGRDGALGNLEKSSQVSNGPAVLHSFRVLIARAQNNNCCSRMLTLKRRVAIFCCCCCWRQIIGPDFGAQHWGRLRRAISRKNLEHNEVLTYIWGNICEKITQCQWRITSCCGKFSNAKYPPTHVSQRRRRWWRWLPHQLC